MCRPGPSSRRLLARDDPRADPADLMRYPSYEAPSVKRGLPRDRSKAELLLVEDGRCPSNLVSGRIGRSVTTIPGIREGQLRGGGTILGSGARTGPRVTAAIRRPRIGARGVVRSAAGPRSLRGLQ